MITGRHKRYIDLAIKIAREAEHNCTFHLAAVLVKRNTIIGIGINKMKTHPASTSWNRSLHAEVSAIIGVSYEQAKDLRNATLYVARVGYVDRQRVLIARPCEACQLAIEKAGIRHVYFTDKDGTIKHWDVRKDEF
jgi:tRNA(Arg) A34 adenosine deaminase TadA